MDSTNCYHCGSTCYTERYKIEEQLFCCNGCKTVYELLAANNMTNYYNFEKNPGAIPTNLKEKFDYLENEEIATQLVDFFDDTIHIITLYIPHIHCSSCIWILENLRTLNNAIVSSQVNFSKKEVKIHFNPNQTKLKNVVQLLAAIGYEPYISLDDLHQTTKPKNNQHLYKLGIAGFAFGNVMFLSFPEYFEVNEFWIDQYKFTFRWLMLLYALPVVFYAAQDYFIAAYKGIKNKFLNIDVPIALGIFVLFARSTFDVLLNTGSGYFDSLTGLVFFLLVGKYFQQKTYHFLSFERDYKSYFPIAITKLTGKKEENINVYDVKKDDVLLIRNQEIIPVDGILLKGNAQIDYSFVTGESYLVSKSENDKVFAGGKQMGGVIEILVTKNISQSYLTQLWSSENFAKHTEKNFKNITNTISKNFTIVVLSIACIATTYWLLVDASKALNVFTAVLIIACPCAIALAAPFTLGNMLRFFGKKGFYLKNAEVIEKMAKINAILFDKTGTITKASTNEISYNGEVLTTNETVLLKSTVRNSNHPLSRSLYNHLEVDVLESTDTFEEVLGKGIQATYGADQVKIGSKSFVTKTPKHQNIDTSVHVAINNSYKGKFTVKNTYRKGLQTVFEKLIKAYQLTIISGDTSGEKNNLQKWLPKNTSLLFNQKPKEKLEYVQYLKNKHNQNVAMIGDGLNDAGALTASDVGIAISENINIFSPACDAILDASQFENIPTFFSLSKKAIQIINYCFLLSLMYNSIGIYFAVTGQLQPVIAAILMPLSSITVVAFTTMVTNFYCKKYLK